MLINTLLKYFDQYNIRYDVKDQMLIIKSEILMKDFMMIKRIIKRYNLKVKEIRVIEIKQEDKDRMIEFFDSHAHYNDEQFDGDRDELLENLCMKKLWNQIKQS